MSVPAPKIRELRYLFIQKPTGRVVAHCLDFDLVTAADNVEEAEKRLSFLVRLQIEDALSTGNYQAISTSAPASYWERFDAIGKPFTLTNPKLTVRVPDVVPMTQNTSSISVKAAMAA